MEKEKELRLPLNLQFFASDEPDDDLDDDVDDDDVDDSKDDAGDSGKDSKGKKNDSSKEEKTFTQKQVNRMMTKEKREGRKSAISSLGFKDEEEAKKAAAFYQAYTKSQKTDKELANEEKKNLEDGKSSAEKRAEEAEAKLACVMAGVNKESVDDVMAIAKAKMTEGDTLDDVLAEMKKQAKYSSFFSESDDTDDKHEDDGTGRDSGHGSKGRGGADDKKGSYGKKLAENAKPATSKKKTYF